MRNMTLICLGRLKERYLEDACREYQKRLTPYCKFHLKELSPVALPSNPSEAEIQSALDAEGKKILNEIPQGAFMVALCIEGTQWSSEELSRQLDRLAVQGINHIVFIIGSSYGLSESIKSRADARLSMSAMTFPHQLARVMLLEQLYRACQISTGGKYHK